MTRPFNPSCAQGVEYKGISNRKFAGVRNDLVGVENDRVARDAPGLVPYDSFAVLACCLRVIAVAVISGSWSSVGDC